MDKLTIKSDTEESQTRLLKYLEQKYNHINPPRFYCEDNKPILDLCISNPIEDEIDLMFQLIKNATGFDPSTASGKKQIHSRAKIAASYILYNRFKLSTIKVGKRLCNRHHTTILIHLKKAEEAGVDISVDAKYISIEKATLRVLRILRGDIPDGRCNKIP